MFILTYLDSGLTYTTAKPLHMEYTTAEQPETDMKEMNWEKGVLSRFWKSASVIGLDDITQ